MNGLSTISKVLHAFGSRDGEGLAWCRSPWAEDKKILLIHGDNTDVDASFKTKSVSQVSLRDFDVYDILISSSPLYSSPDEEFRQVDRLTNLVYGRLSWKKIVYMIVREVSNLYYSRLKVSRNQLIAKSEMVYLIRGARHMGVAMGLDTLKFTSIDLDVRVVIDNLFLKSQGLLGLPSDLDWLYGYFNPPVVSNMPKANFLILTKDSSLGFGGFPEIPWHKQEKEHIMNELDIRVEHGEPLKEAQDKGTFLTISDKEHVLLIDDYSLGDSMKTLAKKMSRSSGTISIHVHQHDDEVQQAGFCSRCSRVGGKNKNAKVLRQSRKIVLPYKQGLFIYFGDFPHSQTVIFNIERMMVDAIKVICRNIPY